MKPVFITASRQGMLGDTCPMLLIDVGGKTQWLLKDILELHAVAEYLPCLQPGAGKGCHHQWQQCASACWTCTGNSVQELAGLQALQSIGTFMILACLVLLQRSATEKYLSVAIHPLVADADSAAAILSSLSAAYDEVAPHDPQTPQQSRGPAQLAVQPSIFAAMEEKQQGSEIWQEHRAYWATKLRGATCTLDLPRSVSRSKTATGAVWSIPIEIPKNIWQLAHRVAANESTQPVAVLLAALQVTIFCMPVCQACAQEHLRIHHQEARSAQEQLHCLMTAPRRYSNAL